MPLGRDLSGPPVLPRIHAVSSGRLVHNPLPFPDMGPVQNLGKGERADPIRLPVRSGIRESRLEFYYYYSNFLVYGGAGSGKTKSIGKWLLSEYMRLGFAGFIYDFKDTDYTVPPTTSLKGTGIRTSSTMSVSTGLNGRTGSTRSRW